MNEPATTLTDYLLAAASLLFAIGTSRRITARNPVTGVLWCGAFIASAVAAAAGGTYHGFAAPAAGGRGLWNLTMFSMGACGAFAASAIHAAQVRWPDGTVQWLAAAIAVTLLGAAVQQGLVPGGLGGNRNATYHLIQIVGLYCLFRCARTVRDRPGPTPSSGVPDGR